MKALGPIQILFERRAFVVQRRKKANTKELTVRAPVTAAHMLLLMVCDVILSHGVMSCLLLYNDMLLKGR
jgi:hypothetical protein